MAGQCFGWHTLTTSMDEGRESNKTENQLHFIMIEYSKRLNLMWHAKLRRKPYETCSFVREKNTNCSEKPHD